MSEWVQVSRNSREKRIDEFACAISGGLMAALTGQSTTKVPKRKIMISHWIPILLRFLQIFKKLRKMLSKNY